MTNQYSGPAVVIANHPLPRPPRPVGRVLGGQQGKRGAPPAAALAPAQPGAVEQHVPQPDREQRTLPGQQLTHQPSPPGGGGDPKKPMNASIEPSALLASAPCSG